MGSPPLGPVHTAPLFCWLVPNPTCLPGFSCKTFSGSLRCPHICMRMPSHLQNKPSSWSGRWGHNNSSFFSCPTGVHSRMVPTWLFKKNTWQAALARLPWDESSLTLSLESSNRFSSREHQKQKVVVKDLGLSSHYRFKNNVA